MCTAWAEFYEAYFFPLPSYFFGAETFVEHKHVCQNFSRQTKSFGTEKIRLICIKWALMVQHYTYLEEMCFHRGVETARTKCVVFGDLIAQVSQWMMMLTATQRQRLFSKAIFSYHNPSIAHRDEKLNVSHNLQVA